MDGTSSASRATDIDTDNENMEKQIIGRGLLAGALGGVLATLFARTFSEPLIDRAIGYEDGVNQAREAGNGGHEHGVELFSRAMQANVGMSFAVLGFGLAMGALFAVTYCVVYGRVGNLSARTTSVLLAGAMLMSLWVVPALKYPPNPPAASLAETITQRSSLYLLMVVLSCGLMTGAVYLGVHLVPKLGRWYATAAAASAYIAAVALVMVVLPTVDETPGPLRDASGVIVYQGFPADDLYQFRLASLGAQVVMWTTIGLVFAELISRLVDRRQPTRSPVPA